MVIRCIRKSALSPKRTQWPVGCTCCWFCVVCKLCASPSWTHSL